MCYLLRKRKNVSEGRAPVAQRLPRSHHRLRGLALGHRGLFSGLETQRNLSSWIWNLLGTGDPFIPSNISLLQWECLSCACPTIVFWEQIICFLVSQDFRWKGILSQDGSYLASHSYLILLRFGTFGLMIFKRF